LSGIDSFIFPAGPDGWHVISETKGFWAPERTSPGFVPDTPMTYNDRVNYLLICQK